MSTGLMTAQYTVWCGVEDCQIWHYVSGRTIKQASISAKHNGWKYSKQHGWLCPAHAKDINASLYESWSADNL